MIQGFIKGLTVGLVLTSTIIFSGATEANHGGERHPRGYGKNPCVTKAHDMAVSRDVYDEWDHELNFIGCSHETLKRDAMYPDGTVNKCMWMAYDIAQDWIKHGQPILNLTVDKMGRALYSRLEREGRAHNTDCALHEDWAWSDGTYEGGR